ncbi:MAG: efflux RND transporter periplasmic adaptor subunit [Steroidobacteraceae bacterium]
MNPRNLSIAIVVALLAAAGGYWLGRGSGPAGGTSPGAGAAGAGAAGTGAPTAATAAGASGEGSAAGGTAPARRILYYRHPMGLKDTSSVPKKDEMGMDYIPVYADEQPETKGLVTIPSGRLQELGVRVVAAAPRMIHREVSALGSIEIAEPRQYSVAPKFGGWIERLHVDATGARLRRGQPLLEVYSPELVTAQQEYLIASDGGLDKLADGALQKLRNWDMGPAWIARLQQERKAQRTVTIAAPADGTVLEKAAVSGMRFMPGEVLYRLADLSKVWVVAALAEQDLPGIGPGQPVRFTTPALPGASFDGRVQLVLPILAADTRTARLRIELANADGRLRPAMSGRVEFAAAGDHTERLAIPQSAVIDSGTRQVVLLEQGPGRFVPRDVQLGERDATHVEVRSGLEDGDRVVESGNFLLDAESNLRGALAEMAAAAAAPDHSRHQH